MNPKQLGGDKMGFAQTLKELSSPIRRQILLLLRHGRLSAGEIAQHFTLSGATMSYHLTQLKKAGLIFEEKDKNFIYYELNTSVFEEVLVWITQFMKKENENEKD